MPRPASRYCIQLPVKIASSQGQTAEHQRFRLERLIAHLPRRSFVCLLRRPVTLTRESDRYHTSSGAVFKTSILLNRSYSDK